MKPDWCPADIWDAAYNVIEQYYGFGPDDFRVGLRAAIARAIIAERERIAAMAEDFGRAAAEPALFTLAEIIRAGGK